VRLQDKSGVETTRLLGPAAACGHEHEGQESSQDAATPGRDRAASALKVRTRSTMRWGLVARLPPQRDGGGKLGGAETGRQDSTRTPLRVCRAGPPIPRTQPVGLQPPP
jgi:hypothetical protein